MLYVEDDIRMLASERSHGMRTNVWGEQIRCMNTESILLVNIRRHRTGGEVLCVCEVKFWEWWKCTSLGCCRLCKSRLPINQRRFLRLSYDFLVLAFSFFAFLLSLSLLFLVSFSLLPCPCCLFLSVFPFPCFFVACFLAIFLASLIVWRIGWLIDGFVH